MTIRLLVLTLLFSILSACQGDSNSRAVVAQQRDPLMIEVLGAELRINGRELSLGENIDAWISVISGKPRCMKSSPPAYCVWDDLGLVVGTGVSDTQRVMHFSLDLAVDPVLGPHTVEHLPKNTFRGTLLLDGIDVSKETLFSVMHQKLNRVRHFDCDVISCISPTASFNDAARIYIQLSGDNILTFSMSCVSPDACVHLLQENRRAKTK